MSKLIIIIGSSSLTQAYLAYYPSFHPSAYSISLLTYHETLSLACHQTSQQTLQPTSLPTYYPRSQHNVPSTFHLTLHSTSYPNAHPTTHANLTQHLTRPLTGPPIIPFTRCNHCFHSLILDRFHKFLIWFDLMFIITWEDKPKPVSHFWVTRLIRNKCDHIVASFDNYLFFNPTRFCLQIPPKHNKSKYFGDQLQLLTIVEED